jgi:hypothetical protein
MEFLQSNLLMFIFVALAIASRYPDYFTSKRGIYYGTGEGNKILRTKYGDFDAKKNIILSAIVIAAGGSFHFIFGRGAWALILPFVIIGSLMVGFTNWQKQTRVRERQMAFLSRLRSVAQAGGDIAPLFNNQMIVTTSGRQRYADFRWIYIDSTDDRIALPFLQGRIAAVSLLPGKRVVPSINLRFYNRLHN